jgi:hypothetical protein
MNSTYTEPKWKNCWEFSRHFQLNYHKLYCLKNFLPFSAEESACSVQLSKVGLLLLLPSQICPSDLFVIICWTLIKLSYLMHYIVCFKTIRKLLVCVVFTTACFCTISFSSYSWKTVNTNNEQLEKSLWHFGFVHSRVHLVLGSIEIFLNWISIVSKGYTPTLWETTYVIKSFKTLWSNSVTENMGSLRCFFLLISSDIFIFKWYLSN